MKDIYILHPEKSSWPSLLSLCQSLDGEPATLLQYSLGVRMRAMRGRKILANGVGQPVSHQASLLGAELEAGKHLYTE